MAAVLMLEGAIAQSRGNADKAISAFHQAAQSVVLPPRQRVRAFLSLAQMQLLREQFDSAYSNYDKAIVADPTVADPHFFKAVLLNKAQRFSDAENELRTTYNLDWIDQSLQHEAIKELEESRRGQSESE
jgi:tetratricopeptide (TPR) repeat protein